MTNIPLSIVVSDTYPEITEKMLEATQAHAKFLGAEIVDVIHVPGCFDMPLAIKKLLQKNNVDGVVTLGAIIQGDTDHDALIAYTVANKITELSLEFNKPVTLGISGPKMTMQQAIDRIEFFGKNSVEACVKMIQRLK